MTATGDTISPEGVTFLDDVPERGNPVAGGDLRCLECGTSLDYSGRGRKPKYCDQHKRTSTPSAGGRSTSNKALIERAISQLDMGYSLMGGGLMFVAPVAGHNVTERSTQLAESWRAMLEVNKKLRDMFARVEKGAAWLPLIVAHGDLALAIIAEVQQGPQGAPKPQPRGYPQEDPQYVDVQGFVGTIIDEEPAFT